MSWRRKRRSPSPGIDKFDPAVGWLVLNFPSSSHEAARHNTLRTIPTVVSRLVLDTYYMIKSGFIQDDFVLHTPFLVLGWS